MVVSLRFHDILAALITVFGLAAFASDADAQTRTFDCGKGRHITLTVTGPNSISARPIEGGTLNLKKSPKDPLLFTFGPDYSVKITPSQTDIEVHIADFGTLKCNFKQAGAPPPPQPVRGCEEGFKLEKGQCVRLAVGAVKNPCGRGMRPVPETDRCVPVGTSKANEMLPISGRSFGGIMRSAPNMRVRQARQSCRKRSHHDRAEHEHHDGRL